MLQKNLNTRLTFTQVTSDISTHLTLRFKHGNLTVFVFADELATISQIKQDLLETLRDTKPDGLLPSPSSNSSESIALPDSAEDIILGVPVNKNDLTEGWSEMESEEEDVNKECPKTLGLRNADALAFVINQGGKKKVEFWVEFSDLNALYPDEEEDVEMQ